MSSIYKETVDFIKLLDEKTKDGDQEKMLKNMYEMQKRQTMILGYMADTLDGLTGTLGFFKKFM